MSRDWKPANIGSSSVTFLNKEQGAVISLQKNGVGVTVYYSRGEGDLHGRLETQILGPEAIFSIQWIETKNYRSEDGKWVKISLTMKGGEVVILHVKIQKT